MKNIKFFLSIFFALFGHISSAQNEINLISASTYNYLTYKFDTPSDDMKSLIFHGKGYETKGIPVSMFQSSSNTYYILTSNAKIHLYDFSSSSYSGSWLLNLFIDDDLEPEISGMYEQYRIEPEARSADNLLPVLGCLAQHPLRYGDIDGDGAAELVVFAQDEYNALGMTLFSTALKKTLLNVRVATYDAVVNDRLSLEEGEEPAASNPLANAPTDGQYLSRIAEDNTRMVRGIVPAVINFSKLYAADFDEDEAHDLVVWRKLYETRLNQDAVRGFKLTRNTLIHYKLVNGEYQKQATTPAVIQGWLAAKQLTWQKGYPSKSECPGQENQLIPEMHDPLLNDPDVLQ